MPTTYIPQRDADARDWYNNFAAVFSIAGNLAALGFVAADATIVTSAATNYSNAYTIAVNPSTRTSATVAAKDAAKAAASLAIRPYAQRIQANPSVSNSLRDQLGLIIRDRTPSRRPVPVTHPLLNVVNATPGVHLVRFADSSTPASRRKPPLVSGLQLYRAIGEVPAESPTGATFLGVFTRNPVNAENDPGDAGSIATYFARWQNARGEVGPWSAGASLTVAF